MALASVAAMERTESTEQLVARAEQLARVNGCIKLIANLQRAVIMLSLVDDLSHDETGKLLGLSPGYVRVLLHRAREHVHSCARDGGTTH
jgi:RNA polymerase sigma factor (sigma-70 family)